MKTWTILYRSKDIYPTGAQLHVSEMPAWTAAVQVVSERVDKLTGHRWCAPPEWTWKIPVGSLARDGNRYWEKSLGDYLYGSFQKLQGLSWTHKTNVREVDVDEAWLEAYGIPLDPLGLDENDEETKGENENPS